MADPFARFQHNELQGFQFAQKTTARLFMQAQGQGQGQGQEQVQTDKIWQVRTETRDEEAKKFQGLEQKWISRESEMHQMGSKVTQKEGDDITGPQQDKHFPSHQTSSAQLTQQHQQHEQQLRQQLQDTFYANSLNGYHYQNHQSQNSFLNRRLDPSQETLWLSNGDANTRSDSQQKLYQCGQYKEALNNNNDNNNNLYAQLFQQSQQQHMYSKIHANGWGMGAIAERDKSQHQMDMQTYQKRVFEKWMEICKQAGPYQQMNASASNNRNHAVKPSSSSSQQLERSIYRDVPNFDQLNLAAELCAEIKTRLPNRPSHATIRMEDLLVFLEGKILYHDELLFTIQVQADAKLHCNCSFCDNHHVRTVSPTHLSMHLGYDLSTFKLMVKQLNRDGIALGHMLTLINDDLIDTHVGHCCECKQDGQLLCCDGCPWTYHAKCVGLEMQCPQEDWYCPRCLQQNRQGQKRQFPNKKPIKISKKSETKPHEDLQDFKSLLQNQQILKKYCNNYKPQTSTSQVHQHQEPHCKTQKTIQRVEQKQNKSTLKNQYRKLFSAKAGLLKDGQEIWFRDNSNNKVSKHDRLKGHVIITEETRGIVCDCCSSIVSLCTFGHHAGLPKGEQIYDYVYTTEGKSLRELLVEDAQQEQLKQSQSQLQKFNKQLDKQQSNKAKNKISAVENDSGSNKQRKLQSQKNQQQQQKKKQLKLGPAGADNHRSKSVRNLIDDRAKLVINRFSGLINAICEVPSACYLCHEEHFDIDFSDLQIIFCDQCEREFHVGCLRENEICDLKEVPQGEWFCCENCIDMSQKLRQKVRLGEVQYGEGYQVRFLRGGSEGQEEEEAQQELTKVLELMRTSFDPIKDGVTGVDLLPYMVKGCGTDDGAWDFTGMYVLQLKMDHRLVGAATFRIFGEILAEIPLVAVEAADRGQGHCRTMMTILENLFCEMNVAQMLLPAAGTTLNMWQQKFGCRPLGYTHAKKLRYLAKYMCFPDCTMVYKYLDDQLHPEYQDEDISDIYNMPRMQVQQLLKKLQPKIAKLEKKQSDCNEEEKQQERRQSKKVKRQKIVKQPYQDQVNSQKSSEELCVQMNQSEDGEDDNLEDAAMDVEIVEDQNEEFSDTPKSHRFAHKDFQSSTKDSSRSSEEVLLNFTPTPTPTGDPLLSAFDSRQQPPFVIFPELVECLPTYLLTDTNNEYRTICIVKNGYYEDWWIQQILGEDSEEISSEDYDDND